MGRTRAGGHPHAADRPIPLSGDPDRLSLVVGGRHQTDSYSLLARLAREGAMPQLSRPPFASVLRRLRLAAELSQEELAERARVSAQSISALERGVRRAPYDSTIASLAAALNATPEDRAAMQDAAQIRRHPRQTRPSDVRGIPVSAASFVGRERECRDILALLRRSRFVTVCGCGGIGKTRTVVEILTSFDDRATPIVYVDLVSLIDAGQVPGRIATSIGVDFARRSTASDLADLLQQRALLLVLNNCEHVVDACAAVVESLLSRCPHIRILTTSREPLLVDGEAIYRLGPLEEQAADLFIERAAHAASHVTVERSAAETIARQVDGLPLAIELAAALLRTHSPEAITDILSRDPLAPGARRRTAVEHQRTMHDTIGWSYALLAPPERFALRVAAAPVAGLEGANAAQLCGGEELVQRLVDVSLVTADARTDRLRMHEMTRQYALRQTPREEAAETARRHAKLLSGVLAKAGTRAWRQDTYSPLRAYGDELDNLRQLLGWALEGGEHDACRELLSTPDYWTAVGRPPEGFEWIRRCIDRFGCDEDDARDALLAFGLSKCAVQSGHPGAAAYARRAAHIANGHGLALIAARSRIVLGNAQFAFGEADDALDTFGEGVVLFEALHDDTGLVRVLTFMALSLLERGQGDDAAAAIARANAIRDYHGAPDELSDGLLLEIAEIELARSRGDLAGAMERGRRAVASRGDVTLSMGHVRIMRQLLDLLIADGRLDEALALGAREAAMLKERGFDADVALVLERCALIIACQGCVPDAVRVAACARDVFAKSLRSRLRIDRDIVDQLEVLAPGLSVTSVPTIAEAVAIVTERAAPCL